MSTGLPFGGDEIAKTSNANGDVGSLTAGGGVMLGIGAMWTPLWLSQDVGLGASVDASVKYDSLTA